MTSPSPSGWTRLRRNGPRQGPFGAGRQAAGVAQYLRDPRAHLYQAMALVQARNLQRRRTAKEARPFGAGYLHPARSDGEAPPAELSCADPHRPASQGGSKAIRHGWLPRQFGGHARGSGQGRSLRATEILTGNVGGQRGASGYSPLRSASRRFDAGSSPSATLRPHGLRAVGLPETTGQGCLPKLRQE
jgi:hypothetical protein